MERRAFLKILGACAAGPMPLAAQTRPKLNIVLFLADDLGWADVGFNGSDFYETPNLDRLARQGMRFPNGYAACPVCSPTRASIMTGKYPARLHLTNFIPGRSPRRRARLVPPEFEQQLNLGEVTIAEALGQAGYAAASIGKWHLGPASHHPDKQGFHLSYVTGGRHLASSWSVSPPHQVPENRHRWEALAAEGEKFIEENKDRPFFLYMPFHLPHIPLESTQEKIGRYEKKMQEPRFRSRRDLQEPSQNHPVYAAMLECLDDAVGRVLRKLDETGTADRTVVIFTSDNGGLTAREFQDRPTTSNAPLREGKGHVYEGGIRVPLAVRWPGAVKPGSVCEVPVSTVDFYPTFLEIAGLGASQTVDGESLVPLLRQRGSLRRNAIYWHYPHYSNQGGVPAGAVRAGNYKLIELYEDNRIELYDLGKDIGENNNLADKLPAKAAELHGMLRSWRRQVDAQMPLPNPAYDPARQLEGLRWIKSGG